MRLISYYALHTFKNQVRKLLKTWVFVFFVVCMAVGVAVGLFASFLEDSAKQRQPETQIEEELKEAEELSFWEEADVSAQDLIELAVGGIALGLFAFYAMGADKNGSRIFLPADVNLLFASPMKPQSVLMFRLMTQLGMMALAGVYVLFQLPNLMHGAGLTLFAALSLAAAWGFIIIFGVLIQVLLYIVSSAYPKVRRLLRPAICGALLLIGAGYAYFAAESGCGRLKAAVLFFNAGGTRLLPVWGWIKGLCGFAMEGSALKAAVCFLALVLGAVLLVFVIWRIPADFYEDAMAKSEETAELLEKARAENSTGIVVKRKKDRSERLRRDGMRCGAGANVFFFKTLYNRFRFAHFGCLTKTMEFYLAAAAAAALICRFLAQEGGMTIVALTLAGLAFFRSLGNPLERDTNMDYFRMIPESTWAKLFWSLMGGTANCFLDVLPAVVLGALLTGESVIVSLAWIPLIVSVDFYGTNAGAFIGLSVPASAGKSIKQIIQVMFVYFGLLPDIAIVALGMVFGYRVPAMIGAAVLNFGLGSVFFGLSPLFIDPKGGQTGRSVTAFQGDPKAARRQFSILGLGVFAMLAAANLLQLAAAGAADRLYPNGDGPSWLLWLCTFAPMYLGAVPIGLWILKKAPASPPSKQALKPKSYAAAAVISVFLMYTGNIAGNLILALLQRLLGMYAVNPLLTFAMDDALGMRILVMVILAPMIEEFIFRKQLIDRTAVYGEKLAVVTSAVIFGLFHGNLSQFFYAAALGLIFGYLYLKTGRLRYTVSLHMAINFLGGVLAPALLSRLSTDVLGAGGEPDLTAALPQLLPFLIYMAVLAALFLAGMVLFFICSRRVSFRPAALELPKGMRLKTVCLNIGMCLFIAASLAQIALTWYTMP